MKVQTAINIVENDKAIFTQALADLDLVKQLYLAEDYEGAIRLNEQIRSRVKLAMHSFPVIAWPDLDMRRIMGQDNPHPKS